MTDLAKLLWRNEEGQDIAEYAVMLAVILVIVIGTVRSDRQQRQQRVLVGRQHHPVGHRLAEINQGCRGNEPIRSCRGRRGMNRSRLLMIGGLALAVGLLVSLYRL